MAKDISNSFSQMFKEAFLILNENSLKFQFLKVLYEDDEIYIQEKISNNQSDENENNKLILKDFLSKKLINKNCSKCNKDISNFEFFINIETKYKIICGDCYKDIKNKENKIVLFEDYITKCFEHNRKYEMFCANCNKNLCQLCKDEHLNLNHEIIYFDKILLTEKEIENKKIYCEKAKHLYEILNHLSKIRSIEKDKEESLEYLDFCLGFLDEIKYAELIVSVFNYFYQKNLFSYEIILNFNELDFHNNIKYRINIQKIISLSKQSSCPIVHLIMKSPGTKLKRSYIPLSEKEMIKSKIDLDGEITGIIQLKGAFYLAGSKKNEIGIFDKNELKLIGKFSLENINEITHLTKIRDENLDLIAICSDLKDIIIISVFQNTKIEDVCVKNEKNENIFSYNEEIYEKIKNNFGYKIECQVSGHIDKVNRLIQLSNNLIASSGKDGNVIIWEKMSNNNLINLQSIIKINLGFDIYFLIECPFTNELICNDQTIDLNTFKIKRELGISIPSNTFNCGICLFNDKFIASLNNDCEGIDILNIENNKSYYVCGRYDYVEAVYTIDNKTFCLCTQNLDTFFRARYSQHFRFDEKINKFKEIGEMTHTGTCNSYINDNEGNFVMGDMGGYLVKLLDE